MLGVTCGRVQHLADIPRLLHVNDFNRFDHTWQVNRPGRVGPARNQIEDIYRSGAQQSGQDGSAGTLIKVKEITGPLLVTRYTMFPPWLSNAARKRASARPGHRRHGGNFPVERPRICRSSGRRFPIQQTAGNTAMMIFALSVVGVFLVLAPVRSCAAAAVILVVPMCLLDL